MKVTNKGNSAYVKMLAKKRQDSLRNKWIGIFAALFILTYLVTLVFGNNDDSSASGSDSLHPITEYTQGRSIEEMDRLIDEGSSVPSSDN